MVVSATIQNQQKMEDNGQVLWWWILTVLAPTDIRDIP